MTTIIIENGSPQAKEFVAYAHKSAVVKILPAGLVFACRKNLYTHFVYPKLFRRKQDIQNTHLKDWTGNRNEKNNNHIKRSCIICVWLCTNSKKAKRNEI